MTVQSTVSNWETLNSEEIEYIFKSKEVPEEFYSIQESKEKQKLHKVEEFKLASGEIIFASPSEIKSIKHAIELRAENLKKQQLIDAQMEQNKTKN